MFFLKKKFPITVGAARILSLALVVEKHRKVQGQNELNQIYQKNEETIADKNPGTLSGKSTNQKIHL